MSIRLTRRLLMVSVRRHKPTTLSKSYCQEFSPSPTHNTFQFPKVSANMMPKKLKHHYWYIMLHIWRTRGWSLASSPEEICAQACKRSMAAGGRGESLPLELREVMKGIGSASRDSRLRLEWDQPLSYRGYSLALQLLKQMTGIASPSGYSRWDWH